MLVVCPYCKEPMDRSERIVNCESCNTAQHLVCWEENLFCCSVFQCKQNLVYPIKVRKRLSRALSAYLIVNVALHFFINYLHPIVRIANVEDAIFLLALEMLVITSGVMIVARNRGATPLRFFSSILVGCNMLFVLTLLLIAAFGGLHSLYALIWI